MLIPSGNGALYSLKLSAIHFTFIYIVSVHNRNNLIAVFIEQVKAIIFVIIFIIPTMSKHLVTQAGETLKKPWAEPCA